MEKATELKNARRAFAMATIFHTAGSSPREVGAKMIVSEDGQTFGTIGGGNLEWKATHDALELIKTGISKRISYPLAASVGQCCGGAVEVFFEVIPKMPQLFIFGAGHVGRAITETLDGTGFDLHLIDEREAELARTVPRSVKRHRRPWDEFVREAEWCSTLTHAVVMTHEHRLDEEILLDLMNRNTRYLGLIGSEAKWRRFQDRYRLRGVDESKISRVRCPIGKMDLGKSPKGVAISLAAELLCLSPQP